MMWKYSYFFYFIYVLLKKNIMERVKLDIVKWN